MQNYHAIPRIHRATPHTGKIIDAQNFMYTRICGLWSHVGQGFTV